MGAEPIVIAQEKLENYASRAAATVRRQRYFRDVTEEQALLGQKALRDLITGYYAVRAEALPHFNGPADYFEQCAFVEGYAFQAGIQFSLDHIAKDKPVIYPFNIRFGYSPDITVHEYDDQSRSRLIGDKVLKEYSDSMAEIRDANRMGATLSFFSWLSNNILQQQKELTGWGSLEQIASQLELRINGTTIHGYNPLAIQQRIESLYPAKAKITEKPRVVVRPGSRHQIDSSVTFDSIAGNQEAKRQLRDGIDMLLDYDPETKSNPFSGILETASTMLIDGPPGSGKTSMLHAATNYGMQRAIAMKKQFERIVLSGTSFKSEYFSRSAQQLSEILDGVQSGDKAYLVAIEDFDTVFFSRDATRNSPENDSILEVMLNRLEGLETTNFGNYLLVATTNHPLQGDGALLRRLRETAVFAPGPQTPEEFLQVLFQSIGKGANKYLSITRKEARELGEMCGSYSFSGGDVKNIGRRVARDISSSIRAAAKRSDWSSLSLADKKGIISSQNVSVPYRDSSSARGLLSYIEHERLELERQRRQEMERKIAQRLEDAFIEQEAMKRLRRE